MKPKTLPTGTSDTDARARLTVSAALLTNSNPLSEEAFAAGGGGKKGALFLTHVALEMHQQDTRLDALIREQLTSLLALIESGETRKWFRQWTYMKILLLIEQSVENAEYIDALTYLTEQKRYMFRWRVIDWARDARKQQQQQIEQTPVQQSESDVWANMMN